MKRILSFAKGNRAEKKIGAKKEKKEGRKVLVKLGNRGESLGKYDKGRKGGWRGEKGEPEFSAIRWEGGLKNWDRGEPFFFGLKAGRKRNLGKIKIKGYLKGREIAKETICNSGAISIHNLK